MELRLDGSWLPADLSENAFNGQVTVSTEGDPFAYITPDGTPRVVYRGNNNDIQELRLEGKWYDADLSANAFDGQVTVGALGNPSAYVDSSSIARVVYRGTDGDVQELRLQGKWWAADLTANASGSGPTVPAAGDPFGYVDSSGIARVVYRGTDNHVHELRLLDKWYDTDLSAIVINGPATDAAGNPFGYVDANGILRVVYQGTDGHIEEIRWDGAWYQADLSALVTNGPAPNAAGDPRAYVWDGILRVVYTGTDLNHDIYEIRYDGAWLLADLSADAFALNGSLTSPAAGDPFAYVDWSGTPRVVFTGQDRQIHEISWPGYWNWANLSNPVGIAPASVNAFFACDATEPW